MPAPVHGYISQGGATIVRSKLPVFAPGEANDNLNTPSLTVVLSIAAAGKEGTEDVARIGAALGPATLAISKVPA